MRTKLSLLFIYFLLQNPIHAQEFFYKADKSVKFISYFGIGSESVQKPAVIGFNAAYYAILQSELPEYVSQGLGIPISFYFETINSCGADKLIEKLLVDKDKVKVKDLKNQLLAIKQKIQAAKVPKNLLSQIKNAYDEFYIGKSIVITLSPNHYTLTSENKDNSPFEPTKQEASLGSIEKAILKAYASFWDYEYFKYRLENFALAKKHKELAVGLLIAAKNEDEGTSGRSWTQHMVEEKPSIYIEAENRQANNGHLIRNYEKICFKAFDSKWYQTIVKANYQKIFVDNAANTHNARALQAAMSKIDDIYRKFTPKRDWLDATKYRININYSINQSNDLSISQVYWTLTE